MDNYLTTKQAADRLKITERAVRKVIADNDLPVFRVGRNYLIPIDVFEKHLVNRRRAGWPAGKSRK